MDLAATSIEVASSLQCGRVYAHEYLGASAHTGARALQPRNDKNMDKEVSEKLVATTKPHNEADHGQQSCRNIVNILLACYAFSNGCPG